ncbi:hypothetical protein UFOVP1276_53 [uncultured Caudovirales phage]|uniref:Uncharacterized protein n=1 Tax=uncultured Caudovirales phage TaxID=2100421 RepID=A0A6J5PGK7_9CAUD|nr:hypothetical protein UFOVP875_84 [uncultured Caudovirales phage]CAB4195119.1 hypothetical protein UFOVP1276_53 [uncultured Caudovirales phage]CAB4205035.1 hypothetical protein UFOVP1403_13 [uncultured Caudovirales phage]CAB5238148.1 hypothetical protein UFOVP1507_84 [uncultured Caudovirales phage]
MAANFVTDLRPPQQPRLPAAPLDYDPSYVGQFNSVLRLYFNQLDNSFSALLNSAGGAYLRAPYGAFSDFTDQTTTANTATLMALATTDFSNQVTIATSKITVQNAGIYNLQFSVQLESNSNAPQDVFFWLKQNGVDIVGSTGKVGLPARKSPGDPFHDIKGWNYFLSMAATDYVEIYWSTTSVDVSIQTYAASGSPTKPSTASVVATMSFVSALPIAAV